MSTMTMSGYSRFCRRCFLRSRSDCAECAHCGDGHSYPLGAGQNEGHSVLQGCRSAPRSKGKTPDMRGTPTPKEVATDYFGLARSTSASTSSRMSPVSPTWPRLDASPPVAPLSTSNSSHGSWSSLFNAESIRHASVYNGLATPTEAPASAAAAIPVPKADCILRGPDSPLPRRRAYWQNSGLPSPSIISKSWNEPISPAVRHTVSFHPQGTVAPYYRASIPRSSPFRKRALWVIICGDKTKVLSRSLSSGSTSRSMPMRCLAGSFITSG
ncbi:hypothetical protein C8J57DRAFT_275697 [Mycena rebaudengoi]|nr:hypothetical protein C8J57DRAFT_275697 [Mycena rebaudengoi]